MILLLPRQDEPKAVVMRGALTFSICNHTARRHPIPHTGPASNALLTNAG